MWNLHFLRRTYECFIKGGAGAKARCSLKVTGHRAVQKLSDGDVVVVVIQELDHQVVIVLVNRNVLLHFVVLLQELSH